MNVTDLERTLGMGPAVESRSVRDRPLEWHLHALVGIDGSGSSMNLGGGLPAAVSGNAGLGVQLAASTPIRRRSGTG
jgi:hypothetical protein